MVVLVLSSHDFSVLLLKLSLLHFEESAIRGFGFFNLVVLGIEDGLGLLEFLLNLVVLIVIFLKLQLFLLQDFVHVPALLDQGLLVFFEDLQLLGLVLYVLLLLSDL